MFNQQSIYDSDFYVISRNSGNGKGLLLHAWNTTEIKANYYNKIVFEYSDVLQYANMPDVAIFHITSLIHKERVQAFKDTEHRKFIDVTTGLCVIDIDDQALNSESDLYDPKLDNSDHRYELSNKLLRMIECENAEIEQYYEVTVSTKGYHIVLQFTEEIMPLLNCKKLKLMNCRMIDCDLSFEKSEVEATITSSVTSIKNPYKGTITVKEVDELIMDDEHAKGVVIAG